MKSKKFSPLLLLRRDGMCVLDEMPRDRLRSKVSPPAGPTGVPLLSTKKPTVVEGRARGAHGGRGFRLLLDKTA